MKIFLDTANLESIRKFSEKNKIEIIVVDNASSDGSAQAVKTLYPDIIFIENKENTGYAYANNQAFRLASGEYVLILNPDTVIPENIFGKLISKMETNPEIGVLSCQLRNMDGSIQQFCYGLPTITDEIFTQVGLDRKYPLNRAAGHRKMEFFSGNKEREVEQPPGTFLFTRKKVLDTIGGFDEQFPIFYNDVDWCNRVKRAGWKIVFTPDVYIFHHKSVSVKKNFIHCLKEEFVTRKKYYAKYYGKIVPKILSLFAPFPRKKNSLQVYKTEKILVVKSSFDSHFDRFIEIVNDRFPDSKPDLMLSANDSKKNAGYSGKFDRVIAYKGSKSWISYFYADKKFREKLRKEQYNLVLFPYANVDGAGYWNIVNFSSLLFPSRIGAFSVDRKWSFFHPFGLKQCRGFFVCITAYLLLLIKSCFTAFTDKN